MSSVLSDAHVQQARRKRPWRLCGTVQNIVCQRLTLIVSDRCARATAIKPALFFRALEETAMSVGTILLIILILLLIGVFPSWPHSRNWGYGPTGGLGIVVIILIVLLLMGRL
ncbi:hypothetical protein AB7M23_003108 [Pseudomonas sp. HLS-6 TE3448]